MVIRLQQDGTLLCQVFSDISEFASYYKVHLPVATRPKIQKGNLGGASSLFVEYLPVPSRCTALT